MLDQLAPKTLFDLAREVQAHPLDVVRTLKLGTDTTLGYVLTAEQVQYVRDNPPKTVSVLAAE